MIILQFIYQPGNNGRTITIKNNTNEDDNNVTRFRRSVHNPYKPCYRQFFLDGQPPVGLRKNLNHIKYICQQIPLSHEVFYVTMFDEDRGIAVYAAYTLTAQTINFVGGKPAKVFKQQPGTL